MCFICFIKTKLSLHSSETNCIGHNERMRNIFWNFTHLCIFGNTAIIHNCFISILASSTLFLLSHVVAYFSVSCHLFKKYCSLCPCCCYSSPRTTKYDYSIWTFRPRFVASACSPFNVSSFTVPTVCYNVDRFSVLSLLLFMRL